ncbi:MAG TPA: hypothetical protein VKA94_08505, partial [Hyphomicrobiales bacterium]|nr:hypothetical protein [Hyphomicrobiales bacterium]
FRGKGRENDDESRRRGNELKFMHDVISSLGTACCVPGKNLDLPEPYSRLDRLYRPGSILIGSRACALKYCAPEKLSQI